jgi:hypothetical protein
VRCLLVLSFFILSFQNFASGHTIAKRFRGRYSCEVPSYEMRHLDQVIVVEPLQAVLLVYKTKLILKIGERSFPANVELKQASRKKPIYIAEFPHPFNTCEVSFDRSTKTVYIDSPIFQQLPFNRVK